MRRGRTLVGVVRDGSDAPIPGAQVFVIATESVDYDDEPASPSQRRGRSQNGRAIANALTDAGGAYRLDHLPPDDITVFVRAPGFVKSDLWVVPADDERRDFVLLRYARILGSVIDSVSRRPVSRFEIRAGETSELVATMRGRAVGE